MISAHGLDKRYGSTHAVQNLSFDVRPGVVTGFLGPNGVGKSTTFSLGMGQRLALAAALLGDPHTLLLDEPANGLDPYGIQWLREFLRRFAAQGRTVFVSSHLLAEMALMADDLVVVGLGRLIAAGPVADFVDRFTVRHVVVRSPRRDELGEAIRRAGAQVTPEADGALLVVGADCAWAGDLAAAHGIAVHELTVRTASLEQAFHEATGGSVRFGAA